MPMYDDKCRKCGKKSLLTLTLKEHETGGASCPSCRSKTIEQLLTTCVDKTSIPSEWIQGYSGGG